MPSIRKGIHESFDRPSTQSLQPAEAGNDCPDMSRGPCPKATGSLAGDFYLGSSSFRRQRSRFCLLFVAIEAALTIVFSTIKSDTKHKEVSHYCPWP